jgi:radical SAM superfamily enzyme YgiQ (UPF0313 family)
MKIKLYMCGGEKPTSEYSLGLGYLKAYCQSDKVNIDIVKDKNELKDCDLIGLSTCDHGVKEAVEIRQSTNTLIAIGGQATLWGGLKKYKFDYIVRGEGESALQAIIDGEDYLTCGRIQDIDTLPFPDRGKCGSTVPVITSRGCPYRCSFCSTSIYWGKVRYHSPEYFIEEIKYISREYPQATSIYTLDDLFVSKEDRLSVIAGLWFKEKFHKKYTLRGFARSDIFNIRIARLLKEMGFCSIRIGIETASNRLLKLLNKQTTIENAQNVIDICNKIGLGVGGSFMHDIPGETREEKQMTLDFIEENKGKMAVQGWYTFKPFAGTVYYHNQDLMKEDMRVR